MPTVLSIYIDNRQIGSMSIPDRPSTPLAGSLARPLILKQDGVEVYQMIIQWRPYAKPKAAAV